MKKIISLYNKKTQELQLKKLKLECDLLDEKIQTAKIKRRALIISLVFTAVGLFLQFKK